MGFKRDDIVNYKNMINDDNTPSFKYKVSNIGNTQSNRTKKRVKIGVSLKHLSNFWRSLEMLLVNCKVELSLKWIKNCVLTTSTNANKATFEIANVKLFVGITQKMKIKFLLTLSKKIFLEELK